MERCENSDVSCDIHGPRTVDIRMASPSDCKSSSIVGWTNIANGFEVESAALPPYCSSKDLNSEEVPAPMRFVRRPRGMASQTAPCSKEDAACKIDPFMAYAASGDAWSFLEPSSGTPGAKLKYYSAHREYVAKLTSSDTTRDKCLRVEDSVWDETLIALS